MQYNDRKQRDVDIKYVL